MVTIGELKTSGGRAHSQSELVVAASDAPDFIRNYAHFKCTGAADDADIQLAINALGSIGGTVLLTEGNFYTAARINAASKVVIRGKGAGATIINIAYDNSGADVYTIGAIGTQGSEVTDVGFFDFTIKGTEHAANTKSQHGIHLKHCHRIKYDNLHFENLSEEGIVHDTNTRFVEGGKISGKDLGSSLTDIGGNTFHIQIDEIFSEESCQVEDTAAVNITANEITPVAQYIQIGKIISLNPGAGAVRIRATKHVTIGEIIGVGKATAETSTIGVEISNAATGGRSEDINIGAIVLDNFGANNEDRSLFIGSCDYVNIGRVNISAARGDGAFFSDPTFCHIGSLLIHDNTDEGTNAHRAVIMDDNTSDCTIDSIVVENWTYATGNGIAVNIHGVRNQISKIRVENADSWDLRFESTSTDNIIGTAVLSGHGTGGLSDGGTDNVVLHRKQASGNDTYADTHYA